MLYLRLVAAVAGGTIIWHVLMSEAPARPQVPEFQPTMPAEQEPPLVTEGDLVEIQDRFDEIRIQWLEFRKEMRADMKEGFSRVETNISAGLSRVEAGVEARIQAAIPEPQVPEPDEVHKEEPAEEEKPDLEPAVLRYRVPSSRRESRSVDKIVARPVILTVPVQSAVQCVT